MSGKAERRAARLVVADYHDAQLRELVDRVGDAIDHYRAGELDAFEVDRALFQYSRAAKELWKFCNYLQIEIAAAIVRDEPPTDWWGPRSSQRTVRAHDFPRSRTRSSTRTSQSGATHRLSR